MEIDIIELNNFINRKNNSLSKDNLSTILQVQGIHVFTLENSQRIKLISTDTQLNYKIQQHHSSINSFDELFFILQKNKITKLEYLNLYHTIIEFQANHDLLIINSALKPISVIIISAPYSYNNDYSILDALNVMIIKKITYSNSEPDEQPINPIISLKDIENGTISLKTRPIRDKINHIQENQRPKYPYLDTYLNSIWWELHYGDIHKKIEFFVYNIVKLISNANKLGNQHYSKHIKSQDITKALNQHFMIGLTGGYSRNEFHKYSDLDFCLIHEGMIHGFLQLGYLIHHLMLQTSNLNLCGWHSLEKFNFHFDELKLLFRGIIEGKIYLFKEPIQSMISGIETMKGKEMTETEKIEGIQKYYWSFLKGFLDMIPVYEYPIGLGTRLRSMFHELIIENKLSLIQIIRKIDNYLNDDPNKLITQFNNTIEKKWNDVFKNSSGINAIQDIGTIVAILGEFPPHIIQTEERILLAMKRELIPKQKGKIIYDSYIVLKQLKYMNKKDIPLDNLQNLANYVRQACIETLDYWRYTYDE
ncbi:MAG: hypothetical protein OEZ01_03790 [Candidatus Heimdallarchaeota archaeon]|nr:hypothetical protein [Candidatus Heimdallarchaeota archaeon]MDH5645101.1 hypothetical protein [Candidatus Heimdallarchaeota archaeon]